jgi:hypothetical protein
LTSCSSKAAVDKSKKYEETLLLQVSSADPLTVKAGCVGRFESNQLACSATLRAADFA